VGAGPDQDDTGGVERLGRNRVAGTNLIVAYLNIIDLFHILEESYG